MKAPDIDDAINDPGGWRTRLNRDIIKQHRDAGDWRDYTIADKLDELCLHAGGMPLVLESGKTHSAIETRQDALKLAIALTKRGLRPGDVVSFQLPNWYEAIVIDLACSYAGFVCNPIVPIYRASEVDYIVKSSGSRALFVPDHFRNFDYVAMVDELRPQWESVRCIVVVRPKDPAAHCSMKSLIDESPAEILNASELFSRPDANHVKLIMYTSGTTSRPKGVLHTHNTISAEISNFAAWLRLSENDVLLMPSPLAHITGYLYGIQLPITLKCPIILMETWDAANAASIIDEHRVTFTIGATPFLQELISYSKLGKRPLPSLRYFPCGGAPVPPDVILSADAVFDRCVAFRVYGSTEAPTVTLGPIERSDQTTRAQTEGYVVGHEARLTDTCDRGGVEEGEIITRGPEVFVGYSNFEDNIAFDAEGFFHTGDLAIRLPNGCLTIVDRKKDIIIRGGENLSPKEIEDVLYTHPAVKRVAVVAMPHPRLGETCCAFVILQPGAAFSFQDMLTVLEKSRIAKQKYPERLEIVEEFPYTASGKIRKNVLREQISTKIRSEND